MKTTILPCRTIDAEELALALEIAGSEGLALADALRLAAAQLAELQAYAMGWDSAAHAAISQPVGAA